MDPMYELVKAYEPEKPEERKARKMFLGLLVFVVIWLFSQTERPGKRRKKRKFETSLGERRRVVMMRVGVVVQHGPGDTMEAKFEAIRREGFTSCQLVSWNPSLWTEEEAKAVNEAVARTGVTLSAFWCGWEGPKVWDFYGGQETLGLVRWHTGLPVCKI